MARVICVGEAMLEFVPSSVAGTYSFGVAGDTFNTAVYLARMLAPGSISYATLLGCDEHSNRILAALEAEGVGVEPARRIPGGQPGLAVISLDAHGERSFDYWRRASAARQLFSHPSSISPWSLGDFDLVVLSAITLAIISPAARDDLFAAIRAIRDRGVRIAFDSNYRAVLWPDRDAARREIARFWSVTDIALPSLEDEMQIFGDADEAAVAGRLAAAGVRMGALKRGAAGTVGLDAARTRLAGFASARVVDSTAAGDSFNAGFLAATLEGHGLAEAMARGHRLASRVIAHRGAIIPRNVACW